MRFRIATDVASLFGGALSCALFPHEPGLTFLLYGGAGGLFGAGCVWFVGAMCRKCREKAAQRHGETR